MQGQSAVVDRENKIEDLESRIDLLQRRLERLTLEKEQDLEAARQQERERIAQETIRPLEVEIAQLKQLLQQAEATSQELQIELQNQLDDRQRQMELWQRRLSQVTAEKDQALEIARQQELDRVGQLEAEVRKLQGRLQVAQSGNEQLEANLQKQQIQNDRQRQALQAQLQEAHEQVKHLTQRERMAQAALSQWIQSDLWDGFIDEVESITDRREAVAGIQRLQQKRLNQEWHDRPVRCHLLQLAIDLLKQEPGQEKEKLAKHKGELEEYDSIVVADAVIAVRAELRYNRLQGL